VKTNEIMKLAAANLSRIGQQAPNHCHLYASDSQCGDSPFFQIKRLLFNDAANLLRSHRPEARRFTCLGTGLRYELRRPAGNPDAVAEYVPLLPGFSSTFGCRAGGWPRSQKRSGFSAPKSCFRNRLAISDEPTGLRHHTVLCCNSEQTVDPRHLAVISLSLHHTRPVQCFICRLLSGFSPTLDSRSRQPRNLQATG
jgi:hypothetical protein